MDFKKKYIKYKYKYLELKKLEQLGGEITEIPDNFYHVMSVTKAVIGILYHIHENDYSRDKQLNNFIKKDYSTNKIINKIITIGDALNMNSGLQNNKWNFDDFMHNLDDNKNLSEYSYNELNCAQNIDRFDYNELMYQLLASNLKDAAKKLAVFMNEPINEVMKEYIYFKKPDGKEYSGFFKEGNGWKWRHTENGEPTGPNGIWMTEEFALKFANKVKDIVMKESKINGQKVPSFEEYDFIYNSQNVLKKYWNGWWFSNKCAYAIGHTFQCIAITPNGVRLQLYHEPNSKEGEEKAYKKEGELYSKLYFIDDIEKSLFDLKHLPDGNRSGLSKDDLVKMVTDKTAVFYLDKANPDNFSIGLKSELKPGYHIHAIFDKGDKYYIDGKEFEHEGSLNMDAFVKTIKDKKGKEWVIYDYNLDPKLDVHLINSF